MKEKILDKIKKLIESQKGESLIGNVAAAEAFAEKVKTLLEKHNLTMTDVEVAAAKGEHLGSERVNLVLRNIEAWECHLLQFIAIANGCMSLDHKSGYMIVIGRETDRRIVIEFFNYFWRLAHELADKAVADYEKKRRGWYFSGDREEHFKEFERSFLAGFAVTIGNRFENQKKPAQKPSQGESGVNPNALIFMGSKSKDSIEYAFEKFGIDELRQTEQAKNRQGFYSGKDSGEKVALTTKTIE